MASPTPGKTQLGLDANVAGLLCYLPICCVGLLTSLVVVIVEKQNRLVKFHALQSLLLHGAAIVLGVAFQVLTMLLSMVSGILSMLFSLVLMVIGVGWLALAILMMVKAYNNEEYRLPVIGDMAANWSNQ
jgi:uncharacterized membrane protein